MQFPTIDNLLNIGRKKGWRRKESVPGPAEKERKRGRKKKG